MSPNKNNAKRQIYELLFQKGLDYTELSELLEEKNLNTILTIFLSSLAIYIKQNKSECKNCRCPYQENFKKTLIRLLETCPNIDAKKVLDHFLANSYKRCTSDDNSDGVNDLLNEIQKIFINKISLENIKKDFSTLEFLNYIIYNLKSVSHLSYILKMYPFYVNTKDENDKPIALTLMNKLFAELDKPNSKKLLYFNRVVLLFIKDRNFYISKKELEQYCLEIEKHINSLKVEDKNYKKKLSFYKSILNILLKVDVKAEDKKTIDEKYGITKGFNYLVLNELKELMKKEYIITIDSERTLSMDDALSVSFNQDYYHLCVYISFVAKIVKANSFIDIEAKRRMETIYSSVINPMMPFELSHGMLSLNDHSYKDVIKYSADIYTDGSIANFKIEPDKILVNRKFSYSEANEILSKQVYSRDYETLYNINSIWNILRKRKEMRSSYLALKEEYLKTESQVIVEQCMNFSNEMISAFFKKNGYPYIYLNQGRPSNTNEYKNLLKLEKLLETETINSEAYNKTINALKRLSLPSFYSVDNIGHFGLNSEAHGHNTAPVRRHPDIENQRIIIDYVFTPPTIEKDKKWNVYLPEYCKIANETMQKNRQYILELSPN